MNRSRWRTGPPIKHTQPIVKPTGGQWLRQIGVLALILLTWGGGFFMLFRTAPPSQNAPVAAVQPTEAPALEPPGTPIAAATSPATVAMPSPTHTPTLRSTETREPAATPTALPATATPTAVNSPTAEAVNTAAPATGAATAAVSFERTVLPIFKQVCGKCHGGDKEEEGLNLLSYDNVMRGSDNGPVVAAGDAANSLLVQQVESGDMPKRGPKLLPKQIQAIVDWVNAGAPNN
jgi:mono/diheme cytochrome c family protein